MSQYIIAKSIGPGIYNGTPSETKEVLHIVMDKQMASIIRQEAKAKRTSMSAIACRYIKMGMEAKAK